MGFEAWLTVAVVGGVFALLAIVVVLIRRGEFGRRLQAMKTSPAACASGMPINPSGRAFCTHCRIFFLPSPGSINTGTAPIRNRAKVRARNSMPGGTIRSTRWPFKNP